MSNASTHTRTRATHRRSVATRSTHGDSGYLGPITGAEEVYEQTNIDGVVGPGDIPPNTLPGSSIVDGTLEPLKFADQIIVPEIVTSLPTLPDPLYPQGKLVFYTIDEKLYRNTDGNTWSVAVDGADIIANSITAGQIAAAAIGADEIAAGAVQADKIAVGAVGGAALQGDGNNLLPFPGAENPNGSPPTAATTLPGWTINTTTANCAIRTDSTHVHTGAAAFQYVSTQTSGVTAFSAPSIPVMGGRRYNVSAWVAGYSGNVGNTNVQVIVQWRDATLALVSQVVATAPVLTSSETYFQSRAVLAAPAGAAFATFVLFVDVVTIGNRAYFDDLEFSLADMDVSHAGGNVLIDKNGITVNNGFFTIQDEFGKTVMVASGFSGSWIDFVQLGLYNARFVDGVVGTIANGRTVALPYWTTSNAVGTPTATFLTGGGVKVTFSAVNDRKRFVSDKVTIRPDVDYGVPVAISGRQDAGSLVVAIDIFWYQSDGTTAASTASTSCGSTGPGSGTTALSNHDMFLATAPSDARYAKVRVDIYELTTHDVDNFVTLHACGLKEVPLRNLIDPNNPGVQGGFSFDYLGTTRDVSVGQLLWAGDSTFANIDSGDLADGALFYRTDLNMWFRYDGTRWLCTCPHDAQSNVVLLSATSSSAYASFEDLGGDIWIEQIATTFFVAGGGSALSGSHKWVGTGTKLTTGTAVFGTVADISSGASSAWRTATDTVNAVYSGSASAARFTWTKTGTPGDLTVICSVRYRHIAT